MIYSNGTSMDPTIFIQIKPFFFGNCCTKIDVNTKVHFELNFENKFLGCRDPRYKHEYLDRFPKSLRMMMMMMKVANI